MRHWIRFDFDLDVDFDAFQVDPRWDVDGLVCDLQT